MFAAAPILCGACHQPFTADTEAAPSPRPARPGLARRDEAAPAAGTAGEPGRCRCACRHDGGCLTCGCTCPAADPDVCPCCGASDADLTTAPD
jgi:hypothetical protein